MRSVFGAAINVEPVTIQRRRWFPFQPTNTAMAPMGHIHFPPNHTAYCDDFAEAALWQQGLLIHEMTHVWQTQERGKFWLVLMRHPFCRYDYTIRPGQPLAAYGIEQQAEIVRHAFLLGRGHSIPGAPHPEQLRNILPFRP